MVDFAKLIHGNTALADDFIVVSDSWEVIEDTPAQSPASSAWTYRDYQRRSFAAVDMAFEKHRRILVVQATGTGKTVLFTYLANQRAKNGKKVLILAHAEELLDQAADKLLRSTGLVAAKEKAHEHASSYDSVVVASVQTLRRESRLKSWAADHFDLIIVDEAHRSKAKSYETILAHFTGQVLGVTATADRGDKKSLADIYETVAFEFNLLEAVHEGWLVRPRAETIPLKIDLKGVKTSRTGQGSDYDLTEVSHRIAPFLGEIGRQLAARAIERGQGIVFLPSVETARMMAESLREAGLSAEYVSGECDNRTEKIEDFKAGRTTVLCNAMLLIEGFDHDAVGWVSVLRPTKIRALYVQAVGRGTRPLNTIVPALNAAPDAATRKELIKASAKPLLYIFDFLWLTEKLDLIAPANLVTNNPKVAAKIAEEGKEGDLIELAEEADRDLLRALEKAAAANKHKKGRMIDPLELAVSLKAEDLKTYEPKERWEFKAPSDAQLDLIAKAGVDVATVTTAGMASKVIEKIKQRQALGLCTIKQMSFLERMGIAEASTYKFEDASRVITNKMQTYKFEGSMKLAQRSLDGIRRSGGDDMTLIADLSGIATAMKAHPAAVPTEWYGYANMLQFHTNPSVRLAVVPLLHPSSHAAPQVQTVEEYSV